MNSELTNVPTGWLQTRLENCVDILDSKRVPVNADEREKRTGSVPYYGATGQVGWIDDYLFDEELVLLGEDGAPFLEPLKNKAYIIKGKSWVNNHAHVLRAIASLTSNSFICHYLNVFDYTGFVSGTTRFKLNQSPMRTIPVPIPPPPEQRRIVAKVEELFTRLDAGVEALKKIKAQVKRYRQSVLKHAFEGKLTQEWRQAHKHELEPAAVLLERIKQERQKTAKGKYKELPPVDTSDLPDLPEGWGWMRLNLLFDWSNGKGLTKRQMGAGDYYVYGGNGLVGSHNKWLCEREAIVIGRVGAQCGNVHLAPPYSWITDNAIYTSWKTEQISTKFFYRLLSNYKLNELSGGSGQPYVSQAILNPLLIPFPALPEQHKIVEEIEQCFSIADQMEKTVDHSLKQAERLRHSILKRAFEGKLVPQNPNDEPAEKLLERIKQERAKQQVTVKSARSPKNKTSIKHMRLM